MQKNKVKIFTFLIIFFFVISEITVSAGEKIVSFSLKTLKNDVVSIDKLLEKGPVLLNFWALWCNPCKEELQEFKRLKDESPFNEISVVFINTDGPRSFARVRSYISIHKFPFLFCVDPNQEILHLMNSWSIPFSILINKKREIVFRHSGYLSGDVKVMQKEINEYLEDKK